MEQKHNRSGRAKEALFAVIVIILSFSLSVVAIVLPFELYLRHKNTIEGQPVKSMIQFDDTIGWSLKPGSYSQINCTDYALNTIYINKLGLREKEVSLGKLKGAKRITIIGDSFVYSEVLKYGERFTELLSTSLGESWQVVNASVFGYGTGQQLLLVSKLQSLGYDLGDTVILVFFTNDILDNVGLQYSALARDRKKPSFLVDGGRLTISDAPIKPHVAKTSSHRSFLSNLIVVGLLKNTAINFAGRHPKIINAMVSAGINIELKRTPGIITGWYSEGWRERWSTTSAILQYANSQVFEKKSFAILYMPSPLQVEPSMLPIMSDYVTVDQRYADFVQDIDRPRNTLRDFCMSNGISFIDMTPVLREAAQTNSVYFLTEGHLNTEGSKLVSKVIYQYIHENIEKVRQADLPAQGKIDIRLTKP
jgi:hypothetical protein